MRVQERAVEARRARHQPLRQVRFLEQQRERQSEHNAERAPVRLHAGERGEDEVRREEHADRSQRRRAVPEEHARPALAAARVRVRGRPRRLVQGGARDRASQCEHGEHDVRGEPEAPVGRDEREAPHECHRRRVPHKVERDTRVVDVPDGVAQPCGHAREHVRDERARVLQAGAGGGGDDRLPELHRRVRPRVRVREQRACAAEEEERQDVRDAVPKLVVPRREGGARGVAPGEVHTEARGLRHVHRVPLGQRVQVDELHPSGGG
mmetsp:Transcript_1497/g.3848  ORF Transcript_1497/g.3848 Transcript_1497/m.3848 type:complete len:266 (-) Transcript_1497:44-841(-)